ncbi:MAG: hypothetical protein ABI165_20905 [Bryobacteraceae bacterium]
MATLTNMLSWITGTRAREDARATSSREAAESCELRRLAFEDVYWNVKWIDNSRVVRETNPRERGACWRMIGSVGLAVMLLVGVLLPGADSYISGYQIQQLKADQARLTTERSALELAEAKLLSPERLATLAHDQQFVDPPPQSVVYLMEPGNGEHVAMNAGAANVSGK